MNPSSLTTASSSAAIKKSVACADFPVSDIPVRQERGQREVFCGLTSIVWLHRKMPDAFFLVIGSRTCAHLVQSAAGVMIFAQPRFATAILDDRDLAGLADCNDELDRVVDQLLTRRPEIKTLFLVGSCPSEVIKLDLATAAARMTRQRDGAVRVLAYSGSGIETTFTQGEDNCLKAMIEQCDVQPAAEGANSLLVLGALPEVVEDQFARIFTALDIPVSFLPPRKSTQLPVLSKHVYTIAAQPFLSESIRALERAGCQHIVAQHPLGIDGTLNWFKAAAARFGVSPVRVDEVTASAVKRGASALSRYREKLSGMRVCFMPDSQLEIPIARFLHTECGVELVEVGSPFIDKQLMAPELVMLDNSVRLIEGQHVDRQLERIRQDRPDLTVCGLGLANPLEAEGLRTKWSIELVFSPIHGFEQAADLAELFCRPVERLRRLAV